MKEVVFKEQKNGSLRGSWIDSSTRKRRFKIVQKQPEADAWNRERKASHAAHGRLADSLDTTRVGTWAQLDDALAVLDTTLVAVAEEALKRLRAVRREGAASECLKLFLAGKTRADNAPRYVGDLRKKVNSFLATLPKGDGTPMRDITTADIKKHLDGLKTGKADRQNHERNIGGWIRWAVFDGWTGISMPEKPPKGKGTGMQKQKGVAKTYSAHQVTLLLKAAVKSEDWCVLAFLCIGLFAGIRPESEFYKRINSGGKKKTVWLDWANIHRAGIEISAELSKTDTPRVVPLQPILQTWIDFIREKSGGILAGPVTYSEFIKNFGKWKKIHLPKGVKWHQDIIRHCFGTYRLCVLKSVSAVALEMGNSPAVVEAHYWNWTVKQDEADTFWELTPDVVLSSRSRASSAGHASPNLSSATHGQTGVTQTL